MSDKLYKYVGLTVIIIFVICVSVKSLDLNTQVIEGLTNKKDKSSLVGDLVKSTKRDNEHTKDALLINKYKTDYEDLILEMEENVNLKVFELITQVKSNDYNKKTMDTIKKINKLEQFKLTLDQTMKFLDKYSE
jgi:hypothetical protein|tara:strand:+ start:1518 stop:1919 length:402 start_codon:yes stop_codon:yes gene_type:complete